MHNSDYEDAYEQWYTVGTVFKNIILFHIKSHLNFFPSKVTPGAKRKIQKQTYSYLPVNQLGHNVWDIIAQNPGCTELSGNFCN